MAWSLSQRHLFFQPSSWIPHVVRIGTLYLTSRSIRTFTKEKPPLVTFIRTDKSIDPVRLVHGLCAQAQECPEQKKSRWIRRMTPITSIRKTLSTDLELFAKEILKPHFHSGGPPKKVCLLSFNLAAYLNLSEKFSQNAGQVLYNPNIANHPIWLANSTLFVPQLEAMKSSKGIPSLQLWLT